MRRNTLTDAEQSSIESITTLVSHELRGTLAVALMHFGALEREIGGSLRSGVAGLSLSVLGHELRRLDAIVSRVIELQLRGRAVVWTRLVDLGAVVREGVAHALATGLRGEAVVEQRGNLVGWWDDVAVGEILEHLLSNAFKFGGGHPVRIAVQETNSGARIVVRDQGRGLARKDRERIFERGVRSARSRGGGLGLGLWLVREISTAHGGRATAHNGSGRGATFVVTLSQRRRGRSLTRRSAD